LSGARRRSWLATASTALRVLGLVIGLLSAAARARADVPAVQLPISEVSRAIRAAVGTGAAVSGPITPKERAQLTVLYDAGGFAPLWVDASGDPTRDARVALGVITQAAEEGLEPSDYRGGAVQDLATALAGATTRQAADIAQFDVGLSASTLRYFRHVHIGRVDPRSIGFRMTAPADEHDFGALLRSALAEHRLGETAASLTPPLALYRGLRATLAQYRALAADPTLGLSTSFVASVKPGEPYIGVTALRRLLVALGDLPPDAGGRVESSAYEGVLVDGVRHFQLRHGLEADGILGKATQTTLGVPLSRRVRQIELALERLRWLPHLADRFLAVNIPMFHLWAWDGFPANGAPSLDMDIIVGRALNRQTPVFVEEMKYIIFRPYWNVPPSIVRGEVVPALRRDPDYLRRQDMEIVSGPGDGAQPVALSAESLAGLERGILRIRQRPGPRNSLGLVKFVFPNDYNVYLHGTPAPQLFRQARRDFSHGCVRVADPVALAAWALKAQQKWTRDAILAAMNADRPSQVTLTRPIQVILFYVTAAVMPEDGTIHFAEDIYGHDVKLDRALRDTLGKD
jgi:murein L,D-transpeptidase YcbB/YkuD